MFVITYRCPDEEFLHQLHGHFGFILVKQIIFADEAQEFFIFYNRQMRYPEIADKPQSLTHRIFKLQAWDIVIDEFDG